MTRIRFSPEIVRMSRIQNKGKSCSVMDCNASAYKRGWCNRHYQRWAKYGDPLYVRYPPSVCAVDGCGQPAKRKGWCMDHSSRWYRYGDPEAPLRRQPRRKGQPGARWHAPDGYVMVYFPEHPNAKMYDGKVAEHIMVMADHLGRAILPSEEVHHKNGVRDDNRLENLELWDKSHPAGQRVEDKVAWAWEIINRYDPDHQQYP